MQNKPNFNIKDASVTQSGKFIRLFGEYEPNAEGKVLSDNILLEIDQFSMMSRSDAELPGGKTVQRVDGLVGKMITDVIIFSDKRPDNNWLVFLDSGKFEFNGKALAYKRTPPHTKPDFTIKDATVTQSGKFIRLFGEYAPNAEGEVKTESLLVEADQFAKMKRTPTELPSGKKVEVIAGLAGKVISDVRAWYEKPKDGDGWLVFLDGGKIHFSDDKSFNYKRTAKAPREDQQPAPAGGPGM